MTQKNKKAQNQSVDLNKDLARLAEIAKWFTDQQEVDIEKGIDLVREASGLMKTSKARLVEIENEFQEIKKDLGEGMDEEGE
jgi:predicted  nucleic acid-binding Zn-ribbon protein